MNSKELLERFCKAVDGTINGWQRADRLTEIEQREHSQAIIYGITTAALYVLPENDYHAFKEYVHERGFNH